MWLNKRIRGGALYIAIMISLVTGVVLTIFVSISYYNQRQVLSLAALDQLQFNLKSGLNEARSSYFTVNLNNRWLKNDFNDDSIRIKKMQWGAYEMIGIETKNRHQKLKEAAIYGTFSNRDTAILTIDKGRPISLSGKIKLNGNCYFPVTGIKRSFIEGEYFSSEGPLETFLRPAPYLLPALSVNFIKNLKDCKSNSMATDSLVSELNRDLNNNFSSKTVLFQTIDLNLSNCHLAGNIKLLCNEVSIDKSSALNNVFIIANKVHIKKGFKGSLHVIANDSIILEEDCILEYPSSLTMLREENDNDPNLKGIFIGENCIIYGALIAINENLNPSASGVFVKLNKNIELYGLLYSTNYAHIQGAVFGNVFCEKLFLKMPSGAYENHMINCEVDSRKYAGSLVVPALFKQSLYKCCKWL